MIRVAMLSKWHVHAGDYARQAQAHPSLHITAVWDEDAARGAQWAQELGVPFEPDLDKLLAREDVDAVIVDAPTSMHRDVMVAAAHQSTSVATQRPSDPRCNEPALWMPVSSPVPIGDESLPSRSSAASGNRVHLSGLPFRTVDT